jgi:hypothetical protein
MKIKLLTLILLKIVVEKSWGQNPNLDYKSALKVYNLTTFEEQTKSNKLNDSSSYQIQNSSTSLQILHPTIAFQWKSKKNNFHEIELTGFVLEKNNTKTEIINDTTNNGQTINGDDLTMTFISARYEYIVNFNKSKDSKLVPSIGFGINPYYRQNNYSPLTSNSFPTSEIIGGVRTFITPRLTYFLTSKLFVDLNIPLCFFDTYILTNKENKPSIPVSRRTISSFNFDSFPAALSARIGIGIKL